jgi:hypothetical protein
MLSSRQLHCVPNLPVTTSCTLKHLCISICGGGKDVAKLDEALAKVKGLLG